MSDSDRLADVTTDDLIGELSSRCSAYMVALVPLAQDKPNAEKVVMYYSATFSAVGLAEYVKRTVLNFD